MSSAKKTGESCCKCHEESVHILTWPGGLECRSSSRALILGEDGGVPRQPGQVEEFLPQSRAEWEHPWKSSSTALGEATLVYTTSVPSISCSIVQSERFRATYNCALL